MTKLYRETVTFMWPFPPFPNPLDKNPTKGMIVPKFNPNNHEDALL